MPPNRRADKEWRALGTFVLYWLGTGMILDDHVLNSDFCRLLGELLELVHLCNQLLLHALVLPCHISRDVKNFFLLSLKIVVIVCDFLLKLLLGASWRSKSM